MSQRVWTLDDYRRYQRTGLEPGQPGPGASPATEKKRELRRDEDATQRAIVDWLELVSPRLLAPWCAVPNGGARSEIEAAILKGLGARAGAPDLVFIRAGVEVKSLRGGLSREQREFRRECERAGVPYEVVRDLDQFITVAERHGLLRSA